MNKKTRALWRDHRCIRACNCECHRKDSSKPLDLLKLNPLSVAKYFWEKAIDDYALIQDLVYLTYIEALWKKVLLFEEKFQAWEEGPVLESIYRKMRNHYKKHGELDSLFSKTEDIEDKTVKSCLTKVYRNYQKSKKKGQEIDFLFQVQDDIWKSVRQSLDNDKRASPTMKIERIKAR